MLNTSCQVKKICMCSVLLFMKSRRCLTKHESLYVEKKKKKKCFFKKFSLTLTKYWNRLTKRGFKTLKISLLPCDDANITRLCHCSIFYVIIFCIIAHCKIKHKLFSRKFWHQVFKDPTKQMHSEGLRNLASEV